MQIFTMRYNLKFLKLTLYGLMRPQSIRKLKQISGQNDFRGSTIGLAGCGIWVFFVVILGASTGQRY